ncbi:hypothetical protein [Micrococcus sp. M4NT]|uniref:hypothetical protein n=1 Tax=Micrococcus sp. M4NT TaxID=2957501 RepID=UPI0039B06EE3
MGTSSAGITAVNTSDAACALRGRPDVEIVQGGDPIGLRLAPMDARTLTPPRSRRPGRTPISAWSWSPGSRPWPGSCGRATALWPTGGLRRPSGSDSPRETPRSGPPSACPTSREGVRARHPSTSRTACRAERSCASDRGRHADRARRTVLPRHTRTTTARRTGVPLG